MPILVDTTCVLIVRYQKTCYEDWEGTDRERGGEWKSGWKEIVEIGEVKLPQN